MASVLLVQDVQVPGVGGLWLGAHIVQPARGGEDRERGLIHGNGRSGKATKTRVCIGGKPCVRTAGTGQHGQERTEAMYDVTAPTGNTTCSKTKTRGFARKRKRELGGLTHEHSFTGTRDHYSKQLLAQLKSPSSHQPRSHGTGWAVKKLPPKTALSTATALI